MRILGKYFGMIWLTIAAIVYASVWVSPLDFQYASIISFAIPIIMVFSIALFVIALFAKSRHWFYYLIATLIAWPFYGVSLQFNADSNELDEDFSLLNYNVKWFTEARENGYEDVIDWIVAQDVDFLCFREYFPAKNISRRIKERGGYFDATDKKHYNVAILSKYPIVNKGLLFGDKLNNVLYADVRVNQDTLRIYSLHLESMGINPDKLQDREGIRSEYDNVKFKILRGSRARAEQLEVVMQHVRESPYPVVLAGDFNDVPFSHNYFEVKKVLENAFEEKGTGLGATYNGKIPFLRIDNQFFGGGLELLQFETMKKVDYSDHFPLLGKYRIID